MEASREWIVIEWELLETMRESIEPVQHRGTRNKEEIKRYVEENFVFGGEFTLGLPISVLDMISSGIRHFKR
jgi:hypothetical protein